MRWLSATTLLLALQLSSPPIRFAFQPLPFLLINSETPLKHLPEITPGGVALFDFDQDGWIDIFCANGAGMPSATKESAAHSNRLFRNDGHGGFQDVTARSGLAGAGYDTGAAVGDFDNDGFPDLFVSGVRSNALYRNNRDGTFTDVSAAAGINRPDPIRGPLWSVGGAWLDFDGDGRLDLFVVNYVRWNPANEPRCQVDGKPDYCHPRNYEGLPNRLFRNNGNGSFSDVSESSGIAAYIGKGMAAAVADYDLDGRPDIFVTNDKSFNFLFHNEGGGKFSERAFEAGVAAPADGKPVSGMGAEFRDADNDGLPDIFFTALADETFPLFRNLGGGQFEEVTEPSGLGRIARRMAGWSAGLFDFDNDGWKDIFVARSDSLSPSGGKGERTKEPPSVFRNLANGKFADVSELAGLLSRKPQMYRGAAFADLDNDGRIDAVLTALNAESEIWMNRTANANHWLDIRLEGRSSNRDGAGARVQVTAGRTRQYQQAFSSSGYASSSAGPLHFGLGAEAAAAVEVRWPSGLVSILTLRPVDRAVRVSEPSGDTKIKSNR